MTTYYPIQKSEPDVSCIQKYIVAMIVRYHIGNDSLKSSLIFKCGSVLRCTIGCAMFPESIKNTWLIALFVFTNDRIKPSLRLWSNFTHQVRIIFTLTPVLETFNYVISTDRHKLRTYVSMAYDGHDFGLVYSGL